MLSVIWEKKAEPLAVIVACVGGVSGIVECRIIVQNGLADFNYFLL